MNFSYNWLQSFFQKKLPQPEKLAEVLTNHSFEVEEVKKVGKDWVLDIDVLPNRAPDCFSHFGIAREIAAVLNFELRIANRELKEDKNLKANDFVSIEVREKSACPRYTVRVINNVKVSSSPLWLKERLKACGLRSINNIVDITNYVMLDIGQPLHAFDGEKLAEKKIIVRFAKEREKIVTLDEQQFDLSPDILVIADAKKPIGIAGIKGGKLPEIDKKTKVVVLEAANFDAKVIRKGSRKLNLKTDASLRFEHGIDPNLAEEALNRATCLIQEMACPSEPSVQADGRRAKGMVAQGLIDVYSKKLLPKRIKLDLDYLESLLGVKIPEKEIRSILQRLGFKLLNTKYLLIEVPTRRLDVSLPEDLIEEVGRIYGYEKIKAVYPIVSLIPPKRNLDIFWEDMAKNILKEAGLIEVYNYFFVSEKTAEIFKEKDRIEVANPISLEQKYLRASLIPNLLKNVQRNQKTLPARAFGSSRWQAGFGKISIFELGKVFKSKTEEKRMLTGLNAGGEFYQLKGVVDLLLNKLAISSIHYQEIKVPFLHPQKTASIKVDNETIGFLGEVSAVILDQLSVEGKVVLFDIDFDKLSALASGEQEYKPVSRFPSAVRDIAVLVPRRTRVAEVLNKINSASGMLVQDVDLFDLYEGEKIAEGKKNFAFHIIYQAEDRTLSSKEIDEVQSKIIRTLEKNPEWQVRK
ncbi:MAG: phenylalanine--tRNA ligase subunit beta [bacterium]